MDKRALAIQDFNLYYEELFVHLMISEPIVFRPTTEHPDYDPARSKKPKRIPAIAESRTHFAKHPALLDQLATNPTPAFVGECEGIPGGKPTSRPPMSLDAMDVFYRLSRKVEELYWQQAEPFRPGCVSVSDQLQAIRSRYLVREDDGYLLPDATVAYINRVLKRFVNEAKVITGYKAPDIVLNVLCPDCGGELMCERDARSDVRCVGRPLEGPREPGQPELWFWCGNIWNRYTWIDLVTQMETA
ncbi:MAG: hypothetical protein WAS05_00715 [Candidatus Nanopelagicales bacterium]